MSYKCTVCGKKPASGKTISHSHRATKRRFLPNLKKKLVLVKGKAKSVYVCTRCMKSGKALIKAA